MHDIDRTQIGYGSGPDAYQYRGAGRGSRGLTEEQETDLVSCN